MHNGIVAVTLAGNSNHTTPDTPSLKPTANPDLTPSHLRENRCWFPCVDHASLLIAYDVTVAVRSPKISAAFNGKLLDTVTAADEEGNRTASYRFATETLTAARAVGLAVGRFGAWDVPQSPRVRGLFLRASRNSGGAKRRVRVQASAFWRYARWWWVWGHT